MALLDSRNQPNRERRSIVEALLPFTTIAVVVAAIYVAWIFYSRHESNRKAVEAIQAQKAQETKNETEEVFGSGEIRFLNFSIDKSVLKRGETAELCYGVANATSVKIDPPIEQIQPSYNHCMEIAPKKTTTYTITAMNASGAKKSASLTLPVK